MKQLFYMVFTLISFNANFSFGMEALSYSEKCRRLIDTASDSQKINYLNNWIGEKIISKKLLKEFGFSSSIYWDSKKKFKLLNLDWEFINIYRTGASVSLYRLPKRDNNLSNTDNVQFVIFGDGRSSINIKLKSNAIKYPGHPANQGRLIHINDSISVSCE